MGWMYYILGEYRLRALINALPTTRAMSCGAPIFYKRRLVDGHPMWREETLVEPLLHTIN